MSSSDWFSTKKRGKDDQQIAKDAQQALEEKKQKRNKKNPTIAKMKGSASGAVATAKSRRRKKISYDDDDDSDDEFIVDDEDEEELLEESEGSFNSEMEEDDDDDDEEDIVLHDDDEEDHSDNNDVEVIDTTTTTFSRRGRAARRGKTESGKNDVLSIDSSSSDDDDNEESFLLPGKVRRSAPSKLLKKNASAAKSRFNPSLEATATASMNADKKKRKKSADSLMQLKPPALKKSKLPIANKYDKCEDNDDDDDGELTSPCSTPHRTNSKDNTQFEEVFSSDEENNKNLSTSNKPPAAGTDGKSKYFQKKTQETIVLDNEDSGSDSDHELINSLEDTPEPSNHDKRRRLKKKVSKMNVKKNKGKTRVTINLSSDEDEISHVDDDGNGDGDGDGDGDFNEEDVNVAMKNSLKDSKKMSLDEKEQIDIEAMLNESSSDEEDGDQGDEYFDHEKETATNVLRTAEQLSSQVVRAMSGWFSNNKDGSSNSVQGIIVDGAISLGNLDGGEFGSDKSDHKWISNSEMCKACPNITLSKYQLIGVNWMGLLNGMTCETQKGTKNVNGVLADEMGLVGITIYKYVTLVGSIISYEHV
jgi:hypothetical protein